MYTGKWLSMKNIMYRDSGGIDRVWESLSRTTKQANFADGVGMIPVLKRSQQEDCLILVKQYRPPVKSFTLEFPAGLIDVGETPEQAAVRELKEETGYTITTVKNVSPPSCLDPGAEDSTMRILSVEINGDDPVNQSPKPNPEETEFIEVLLIPLSQLMYRISEFATAGHTVDSRVYTYAVALTSLITDKQ
jgi:ADP-sugar pyrophosphatase/8-oxo-dGDP phosphatase